VTSGIDPCLVANTSSIQVTKSDSGSETNTRSHDLDESSSSGTCLGSQAMELGSDSEVSGKSSLGSLRSTFTQVELHTSDGGVQKVVKSEDSRGCGHGLASLLSTIDQELRVGAVISSEARTGGSDLPLTISSAVGSRDGVESGRRRFVLPVAGLIRSASGFLRGLQESDNLTSGSISLVGVTNSASDGSGIDGFNEAVNGANTTKSGDLNWVISGNLTEVVTSDGKHGTTILRSLIRGNIGDVGANDENEANIVNQSESSMSD
jgi:hypothetical protein